MKIKFFSFCIFFSTLTLAQQNMPGQIEKSPYENMEVQKDDSSYFMSNKLNKNYLEEDEKLKNGDKKSPLIGDEKWLKNYKSNEEKILANGNYLEFSNKEISKQTYLRADSLFSFNYYYDTFSYSDHNDAYNKTFKNKNSAKSVQSGYLLMGYQKFFSRSTFDPFWKSSFGLSFNTGRGVFTDDGTLSKTRFDLYLLPIDLMMGAKLHLGRFVGVTAAVGPMLMGAIQNRSDREDQDKDKRVRQLLYGYSADASIEFSLSQMFTDSSIYLKTKSDISDMSLALNVKMIEVSNNKSDKFKISGTSFGIGMKFELL